MKIIFDRLAGALQGRRLRLLFLCVALLLLAADIHAYAWLTKNRTLRKDTEMQLVEGLIAGSSFKVYRYNDMEGRAVAIVNEAVGLPLYDLVFVERNENNAVIFRVPVFGPAIRSGSAFTVTLSLVDRSDVTGRADNNYTDGDKTAGVSPDAVADYISNVIYIKCTVIPEANLQAETPTPPAGMTEEDYIYQTAHAYFRNAENNVPKQTFVSLTEPVTKNSTVTFTLEDYGGAMGEDAEVLYVYIEIGYERELVASLAATRNLSSFDIEDNTIPIGGDLGDFVFHVAPTS